MVTTFHEVRIRYADTDQMQFVYNGKYLEFFEIGRTEMLRDLGLPYREIEERGFHLPVLEAYVKYVNHARYDEVLLIESTLANMPSVKFKIDYKIFSKTDNRLIATGYTVHAFISTITKKGGRVPQFFSDIFSKYFTQA